MNAFDALAVRESSWRQVKRKGLATNPDLPLLDPNLRVRQSVEAIGTRLLCMNAAAWHAVGFPPEATRAWVDREGLRGSLSRAEFEFLSGTGHTHLLTMQMQIHSLYTLAWCTSLVGDFSVLARLPDDLATHVPDVTKSEPSGSLLSRVVLRPIDEMLIQLDAAYCFDWAYEDARLSLKRVRGRHSGPSVRERRKALEWLMQGCSWDEVRLETWARPRSPAPLWS